VVVDDTDILRLVWHVAWVATAIAQKQLLLPGDLGGNLWPSGHSLWHGLHLATGIPYLSKPVSGRVFGYSTGRSLAVFANTSVGLAFILIVIRMSRMKAVNPFVAGAMFVSTVM
jgi:hypothetical protein